MPKRPDSRPDARVEARRKAVVAAERRRFRRRLALAALFPALLTMLWLGLHLPIFKARVILISGEHQTSAAAILAASGLAKHPAMIDVDPGEVAAAVGRLPWIASAAVRRNWPDGISIAVTERTPLAAVHFAGTPTPSTTTPPATSTTVTTTAGPAGSGTPAGASPPPPTSSTGLATAPGASGWALVDHSGRVLAPVTSPPQGLIEVNLTGISPTAGSQLSGNTFGALVVARTLPVAFVHQVASINEVAGGKLTIQLTSPLTVDFGTVTSLGQKYEDVAAALAHYPLKSGDVIDVSVPAAPTVGPS